jgi:hypothetical protein
LHKRADFMLVVLQASQTTAAVRLVNSVVKSPKLPKAFPHAGEPARSNLPGVHRFKRWAFFQLQQDDEAGGCAGPLKRRGSSARTGPGIDACKDRA